MTTKIRTVLLTGFFFFALLTDLQAQAQIPKDSVNNVYSYQGVVKVDSATKQQLYFKAKAWILKTLKSTDNIVELDDKEFNSITASGTIIMNKIGGNGPFSSSLDDAKLNFKVIVQFKEGKLKYAFENFTYSASRLVQGKYKGAVSSALENLDLDKKEKEQVLNDVAAKMNILITSFKTDISNTLSKPKNDW